jgi:hypothetical protein
MRTQWHPLFAKLLRPLVESHYQVDTNVPVGDAPRGADLLLLRRASAALPFRGPWRWLNECNVLKFKGPSVSPRVADFDLLVELGLGIHRRLNERRRKGRQPEVGRDGISFWYLARQLGRRFLTEARQLPGGLEELDTGVWRGRVLERPVLLVSYREIPVEQDNVPRQSPAGRKKRQRSEFTLRALIDCVGVAAVMKHVSVIRVIAEVGFQRVIDEIGCHGLVAALTPEEREDLKRLL